MCFVVFTLPYSPQDMAYYLVFVGLLSSACGLVPSAVRPGALVAPEGTVLIVEDTCTVAYDIGSLQVLSSKIPVLARRLSGLKDAFQGLLDITNKPSTLDPTLNASLHLASQKMESLGEMVVSLSDRFPSNSVTAGPPAGLSRQRRGLFDFGGLVLQSLFGTAMASDVSALGEKLSVITSVVESQNRLLWKEHIQLNDFRSHLNLVVNRTNVLSNNLHDLQSTVVNMENVFLLMNYIRDLEFDILMLKERCNSLIGSLVSAGLSRVDSELLPLDHLRAALHFARANFSLTPFFGDSHLEFYYPLLEATLTDNQILIHIPLKSDVSYTAYSVTPFPLSVNNSLLSLITQSDMFLVAKDFMTVSLTNRASLSHCRSSYLSVHVCPAYLFALLPAKSTPCELAIVRNNSQLIHAHCSYEPVVSNLPVYHAHVAGFQYFYFKEPASVTLICQGISTNLIAEGYYVASDACEVRSSEIYTLPSNQHLGFHGVLPTSLIHLSPSFDVHPENLTVVSDRLKVLSYLNDSDVFVASAPFFLHPHVLYPTVSLPIIILLVVIGLLCVCLKRMENRLHDIRAAANLEVVPPVPKPRRTGSVMSSP